MSMRRLRRMDLPPRCCEALQRKNMAYSKDVLSMTKMELVNTLELEGNVVDIMLDEICRATAPQSKTVAQCLDTDECPYLKTGLEQLDQVLKGGLPSGGIIEIVGPAGAGKTQFCLQSCCLAMGSWSEFGAVYIDTESRFNAERLVEIAQNSLPIFAKQNDPRLQEFADRCMVYSVSDSSQLMTILQELPEQIIDRSVKLIVVDSVANLVRREYSRDSVASRNNQLGKEAATLKMLAENFNIPVIVTNQVTTKFGGSSSASHMPTDDGESYLTAALGTSWSHCVNTRIVLERGAAGRNLTVAKSPIAPVCTMGFSISTSGIELTSAAVLHAENFWQMKIASNAAAVPDADGDPTNMLGTDYD